MNSNAAEIGKRIRAARKAAKLNQTELAMKLDKTMRTIQKYESGEIEPSLGMINAIAKILNVSPADLVGYQKPNIELTCLSGWENIRKRDDENFAAMVAELRKMGSTWRERVTNFLVGCGVPAVQLEAFREMMLED